MTIEDLYTEADDKMNEFGTENPQKNVLMLMLQMAYLLGGRDELAKKLTKKQEEV